MDQNLIESSAELEASYARFQNNQAVTASSFGYGATEEGRAIASECVLRMADALRTRLTTPLPTALRGNRGYHPKVQTYLKAAPVETLALIAIQQTLSGAASSITLTKLCEVIGRIIHFENQMDECRLKDPKLFERIEKRVTVEYGTYERRMKAAKDDMRFSGLEFTHDTAPSSYIAIGSFVMETLLDSLSDLFTLEGGVEGEVLENVFSNEVEAYWIGLTDKACEIARGAMELWVQANPVFLPSVLPPVPWTDFAKGGPVDPVAQKMARLMRTRHPETVAAVRKAIRTGEMQPALDAVNSIQATPFKINYPIMNILEECYRRNLAVKGIPPRTDLKRPSRDGWALWNDKAKKLWRVTDKAIRKANKTIRNDRIRFAEDIETAKVLAGHPRFFIPHNLDWRGREYPMTSFHFQRDDQVRALFLFADFDAPLGEEGLAWLKVHVANCGDFDKVSKKSYDDRVKWVDDNLSRICDMVIDPLDEQSFAFWSQADKPFLFLASCMELAAAAHVGPDYVCCIPGNWDGSCSGLQHLCAMTRAEEGEHVNLTDVETPRDVYTKVSDLAFEHIEGLRGSAEPLFVPKEGSKLNRPIPTLGELADLMLSYDGNKRKLVKRNTMTYSYASGRFGMAEQHMDDLMDPLCLEVLKGVYEKHPFGDEWYQQQDASRFLAGVIHGSIEKIVSRPAQAMRFFQSLARAMAHEGKVLEWTTPIGLPWANRYHEYHSERIKLTFQNKPIHLRSGHKPKKAINKRKCVSAVAPNLVHACDAAHLLRTVNAAAKEGIKHFAMVHDSFGCPLTYAARYQGIIREQFVEMYETHNVLGEVLERAKCALMQHNSSSLAKAEESYRTIFGNFNIKEVLNAKYAFA